MKVLVSGYTFDKTAKQVTFTGYASITLENVLVITNVTRNVIIYNFADATKGGTAATNVLTLTYDTSSQANTDQLQIFYDDPAAVRTVGGAVAANAADSGNPQKMGARYDASLPTYDDADRVNLQADVNGRLIAYLGTLLAGEDLVANVLRNEQRVSYTNASSSTQIKSGAGRFFGFVVNSHTNGTLRFWDQTSSAPPVLLNTMTFAAGPANWTFPVAIEFSTGLYAAVGGTIDFTCFWK